MCRDCPTYRDQAKAFGRELLAGGLLPFLVYGIVVGAVVVTGTAVLW